MVEPRRALDDYDANEMAIPEWRLIQKVGADYAKAIGAEPGQFHNSISDEIANELNIVVVDIPSGRTRWGDEIANVGPVCASMNAKSNKSIDGNDCTQCEYRCDTPWAVDATERRRLCTLNYTILGIDLDHDYMPILIRTHGISALPARQLITQLRMNRALRGDYFRAVVKITAQKKETPYGTAWAMHPKIMELITDPDKAKELKAESNRLLGVPIPLPEGRREEEEEPVAFTPEGEPIYSEEELKEIASSLTHERTEKKSIKQETKPPTKEDTKKIVDKEPLDLDF